MSSFIDKFEELFELNIAAVEAAAIYAMSQEINQNLKKLIKDFFIFTLNNYNENIRLKIFNTIKAWEDFSKKSLEMPDSPVIINKEFQKIYKTKEDIEKICKDFEENRKEKMFKMLEDIKENTKDGDLLTKLNTITMVAETIHQSLLNFIQSADDAKEHIENILNVELNPSTLVEIPSMSKKDVEQAINDILDQYNKGKITKQQMETQMTEFAKSSPNRMITGYGKIKI